MSLFFFCNILSIILLASLGLATLTKEFCIKENKPLIIINIFDVSKTSRLNFTDWLKENSINILNVAGQRESEKGNYEIAKQVLYQLLME